MKQKTDVEEQIRFHKYLQYGCCSTTTCLVFALKMDGVDRRGKNPYIMLGLFKIEINFTN